MATSDGPNIGILVHAAQGDTHYSQLTRFLRWVDALLMLRVKGINNTPASSPADGDCWIVGTSPIGDWAANPGDIARYSTLLSNWEFVNPQEGWVAENIGDDLRYRYDGSGWASQAFGGGGGGLVSAVGAIASTAYDAVDGDATKYLRFTATTAKTATFNTTLAASEWHLRNVGANNLTIIAGSGATVTAPYGGSLVLAPGMTATVKKVSSTAFDVFGQTLRP